MASGEELNRKRPAPSNGVSTDYDDDTVINGAGWTTQSSQEAFKRHRPEGPLPEDETFYIREEELDPNPMLQFGKFFAKRASLKPKGPPIMTLATCSKSGRPSARTIILNGFDEHGFLFFTNCESLKGQNISENPRAALVFFWPEMMLQVRAEGRVEKGSEQDNVHCFGKIPRNMKVLAMAYKQSSIVGDRDPYVERIKKMWHTYPSTVPYPPGWTSYKVIPDRIEFWNGTGSSLITDRVEYVKQNTDEGEEEGSEASDQQPEDRWAIYRLAAP